MEYTEIQKLIDSMGESKLTDLEIEFSDGTKISMKKSSLSTSSVISNENLASVTSNIVTQVTETNNLIPSNSINSSTVEKDKGNVKLVKAPMVGTFYAKSNPNATPFVAVGDKIEKGQTLCIIEAMKLMNEIESDYTGAVKRILVEDGQMVEYGQILFEIE